MAALLGFIICPSVGSITPCAHVTVITTGTVAVLLMGILREMWSDSAKATNCCSPVLGGWISEMLIWTGHPAFVAVILHATA